MMIKDDEASVTAAKEQPSEVISKDKSNDGSDEKAGEWLKLSLGIGGSLLSADGEPDSESRPSNSSSCSSSKVFSCNFFMRKFFSSQALGGHQNAHKRERGAARRHRYCERMMTMMGLSRNTTPIPILRSLGGQPHSLVHKPTPKPCRPAAAATTVAASARFGDAVAYAYAIAGLGRAWTPFMPEPEPEDQTDDLDLVWPRSFRLDARQPEPPQQSLSLKLDVDLRL